MKKSILSIALSATLATSALVSTQAAAIGGVEGLSANVGVVSQYFFRGIQQTSTASASAGLDYENSGFYVGTWVADVEDGLEVDGYFGYGGETDGGFGYSIGYTTYQYTGSFDTSYNEVNLGLSYGFVSLEYTVGEWEDGIASGVDADYDFLAVTFENEGFYGTFGTFGDDAEGDYIELGYGTEVSGFDVGVALIKADDDLSGGSNGSSLVFSLGKSF